MQLVRHPRLVVLAICACTAVACNSDEPGIGSPNGDPSPGDAAAGDMAVGDPAAGDPSSGDGLVGDPGSGDAVVGDSANGDAAGDSAAGDSAAGDSAGGDPGGGDAPTSCPGSAPGAVDTDNDGTPDVCDADNDNDGWDDLVDNCISTPNPSQTDTNGDRIGDACEQPSYDGYLMLQLYKKDPVYLARDEVWGGGILGDRAQWRRTFEFFTSTWNGFMMPAPPTVQGSWITGDLQVPPGTAELTSRFTGDVTFETDLTGDGAADTVIDVPWDNTLWALGHALYYIDPGFSSQPYQPGGLYSIRSTGGSGPTEIPALDVPDAIMAPPDLTTSPDLGTVVPVVLQDADFTLQWTANITGMPTKLFLRVVSADKVLSYWADDEIGSVTIPASELSKLPPSRALISVVRVTEQPFTADGNIYLGVGYIEQQGYLELVPARNQTENDGNGENDSLATAEPLLAVGTIDRPHTVYGTHTDRDDFDYFSFDASVGDTAVVSTYAEQAGSTMDTIIQLIRPSGSVAVENDNLPASSDSALVHVLDDTGSWKIAVYHGQNNQPGSASRFYNLLVRVLAVPGVAHTFVGTEYGSAPDPGCYQLLDGPGEEFVCGVASICTLTMAGSSTASNVNLLIAAAHTYPTDLFAELQHPDGTTVTLTNHTGKVLSAVFDLDGAGTVADDASGAGLDIFDGRDPRGLWTLRLCDWYVGDTGRLQNAVLYIAP